MGRISKDDKIVKENPGLTPYELLNKGLSQARYNALVEVTQEKVIAQAQKEAPQKATETVTDLTPKPVAATPITRPIEHSGNTYLFDTVTQKATRMSRSAAIRFAQKYPKRYEVR